jgi:hypothetical protein
MAVGAEASIGGPTGGTIAFLCSSSIPNHEGARE